MIFVRIAMNILPEKQLEVTQTILSMIKSMEKEAGCLGCAAFCDIKYNNRFSLQVEWETREGMDHHMRSHRFGALLGIKTLLCEPPGIQIYTVSKSEGIEAVHAARDKTS